MPRTKETPPMTLGKRSHAPTQFTAVMPTNSTASCKPKAQKLVSAVGVIVVVVARCAGYLQGIGGAAGGTEGHPAEAADGDGRQHLQQVALPVPDVQGPGSDGSGDGGYGDEGDEGENAVLRKGEMGNQPTRH